MLPSRNIGKRPQAVPPLLAINPVAVGPVACGRTCDDEIQAVSVRIFSGVNKTCNSEGLQFSYHFLLTRKTSSKPTVKATNNAQI